MNTFLSRANTIFAFTLTVMAALTVGCFLSTAFNENTAPVSISTSKVIVKNLKDYSSSKDKSDLGFVTFDLQANLTPIFNWNVKQLFLYMTAEYETPNNKVNQVVLWDKIILRGEHSVVDFKQINAKYYFWDDGNGLRSNKNVTLTLSWNVIPNAGALSRIQGVGSHLVVFPDEYTTSKM